MRERTFWRSRLGAAFRTGWACFIAGLTLQLSNMLVDWVTFPVFCYVIAVTVVGEATFGKALEDAAGVIRGTIQGIGMTILVMQLLSPEKISIGVAVACISVSSFIITYPRNAHLLSKRVALAHSGIIYITAVVQKEKMDEILFPLKLAGTTVMGAVCAVVALSVPFPRLAVFQVHSQSKLSARIASQHLRVMVDAFCSTKFSRASALNLQARSLEKLGSNVHAEITSRKGGMCWESRGFQCCRMKDLDHLTESLSSLREDLIGMELALQSDLGSPRRPLHGMLKDTLICITDWACLALRHACTLKTASHKKIIIEEGQKVLRAFHEELSNAQQKVVMAIREFPENVLGDILRGGGRISDQWEVACNVVEPTVEAEAAAFLFLFNLEKFMEKTMHILQQKSGGLPLCSTSPEANMGHPLSIKVVSNNDQRKACKRCTNNSEIPKKAVNAKNNPSPQLNSAIIRRGIQFICSCKVDREQLLTAFKMSLAMAIGAFIGFWFNKSKGYWADITLALGFTGAAKGGSFKVATLRTLGTVSGSIYGLLVVLATADVPVIRLLALIPWVVFTSFLRQSKLLGYAGAVSALTGAIVILARKNKDSTDEEFTVVRIVEAFMGMTSFILVELLVFPRRARKMVRAEVEEGLLRVSEVVMEVGEVAICKGEYCEGCRVVVMEEMRAKEKVLRKALRKQNELVKEASEEPQFWFEAFPVKLWSKVVEEQEKVVAFLRFVMILAVQPPSMSLPPLLGQSVRRLLTQDVASRLTVLATSLCPTTQEEASSTNNQEISIQHGAPRVHINNDIGNLPLHWDSHFSHTLHGYAPCHTPSHTQPISTHLAHASLLNILYTTPPLSPSRSPPPSVVIPLAAPTSTPTPPNPHVYNPLFLSVGALTFSLQAILHHTHRLQQVIHELLQEENPWNLIDLSTHNPH